MMTPALALFYGGMVRAKERADHHDAEASFPWASSAIIWIFGGFSLAFGPDVGGLFGDISLPLRPGQGGGHRSEPRSMRTTVPFILFFAYQLMFAVIAPALITGRLRRAAQLRGATLKFLILWMILVYIPGLPLDMGRRLPRPSSAWWTLRAASWSTSAPVLRRLSTGHFPRPAPTTGSPREPTEPNNLPLVAVGARPLVVRLVRLQRRAAHTPPTPWPPTPSPTPPSPGPSP